MRRFLGITAGLAVAWAAPAAEREPHIGYVYPAGGRQGTTFEVVIGGASLNEATAAFVSGTGVQATLLRQERQVTPKEQQELREKIARLQEKRKQGIRLTPEEIKASEEMRRTLTSFGRRLTNPSLGEFITLRVSVAADAAPGRREIRLGAQAGLSNPRLFHIGEFPEYSKKDWKNIPKEKASMDPELDPAPPPVDITLPATLNGQIPPGGVDRYRFTARAGQQLVVDVSAREMIPYVADAVPGWFQATVALVDAHGREVASSDDFWFRPDPVISYRIPHDGEYLLDVHDSLYRGREDFIYRITVGELPFVTGLFPPGCRIGAPVALTVSGWNLPSNPVRLDPVSPQPGLVPFQVSRRSNPMPVCLDTLPECLDIEPNDTMAAAQPVALPVIVNGRIDKPGDWDVFRFDGQAGQRVVAEVHARRLDSPLDSVLRLFDPAGRPIAFNDDQEDKASGLHTHHADSYVSVTLPETGCFRVALGDIQHAGGPAWRYRLRLSAPRPDFELRIAPSSLNVHGGASVPITAFALRKDGFTGEIALALKEAPPGFKLTAAVIPAHQDTVRFTLSVPATPLPEPVSLRLEGRAALPGAGVVRTAVPADDMIQAFAYRHLVPAQDLKVAVIGRFRPGDEMKLLTAPPVRIPAGGSVRIPVSLPLGPFLDRIEFELSEPPDGITLQTVSPAELVLQADATRLKPGLQGNLIVRVSGERRQAPEDPSAPADKRRIPLGALPAIPFEIVR
jgi:hypothetical protein